MTDEEIGEQLKEKYRIQMQYYKNALETMLHTEVKVLYISSSLVDYPYSSVQSRF